MDIYRLNNEDPFEFEPIELELRDRAATIDALWLPFWERLCTAVNYLRSCTPDVRLAALVVSSRPPTLLIVGPNRSRVDLWVDCRDHALVDEQTGLHFRLQIHEKGRELTRDFRTFELEQVAQQLRLTFGLSDN